MDVYSDYSDSICWFEQNWIGQIIECENSTSWKIVQKLGEHETRWTQDDFEKRSLMKGQDTTPPNGGLHKLNRINVVKAREKSKLLTSCPRLNVSAPRNFEVGSMKPSRAMTWSLAGF
ncbi:hypothetical protein AWENTII_002813 [Aspergillus wentii]|nr:hypothetical protein MW887_007636 [Aspergillus wentii]